MYIMSSGVTQNAKKRLAMIDLYSLSLKRNLGQLLLDLEDYP
jgi:hypothetical protein